MQHLVRHESLHAHADPVGGERAPPGPHLREHPLERLRGDHPPAAVADGVDGEEELPRAGEDGGGRVHGQEDGRRGALQHEARVQRAVVDRRGHFFLAAGGLALGFFYTAGWGAAKVYSMNEKPERSPSTIAEMVPAFFSVSALLRAL